ncbi:MAG: PAS domain S-box protein [Candidatus Omnitrophica bacterium]|nr:PAS domain S-box protein [Candidatus Omnitrophota bacterium]
MIHEDKSKEELFKEVEFLQKQLAELQVLDTKHKQAEDASRLSEERFLAIFDNIDLGVSIIDTNYKIVKINKYQASLFNKKPSDFEGKDCFREYEKRQSICPHCPGVIVMKGAPVATAETKGITDDGNYVDVNIRAVPMHENGVCSGFIELVENITERKQAAEKMRDYSMRLSYLTKFANDFIILLDEKFCFLETNERVSDSYGYTKEELIGMHAAQLRAPEVRDDFDKQIKPAQIDGKAVFETVHQRKNGEKFPVEISIRATDVEGKRFYQAIIRDISERKKTEEVSIKYTKELEVFYKASFGREERIVELKKEVEALRAKLAK